MRGSQSAGAEVTVAPSGTVKSTAATGSPEPRLPIQAGPLLRKPSSAVTVSPAPPVTWAPYAAKSAVFTARKEAMV